MGQSFHHIEHVKVTSIPIFQPAPQPPSKADLRLSTAPAPSSPSLPLQPLVDIVTREWIKAMIPTRQTFCDVLITPEVAKLLLELNTNNRPIHKRHLMRLMKSIRRPDGWRNTGAPIIISLDGVLNDGQHRLRMVIETGIPAIMDIRFGIDRAAFIATDTGEGRTGGDNLSIIGYTNSNQVAAIAKGVFLQVTGRLASSLRVEPDELVMTLDDYPWIHDIANSVHKCRMVAFRQAWMGVALSIIRMAGNPHDEVMRFFGDVDEHRPHSANHSNFAILLNEQILNTRAKEEQIRQITRCADCVEGWNGWAQGKVRKNFPIRKPDAPFPTVYKMPDRR